MDFICFVVLLNRRPHRILTGEHRDDVVARDEFEIVDHPHHGRVGNGHRELAPFPLERQDGVLGREFGRNELEEAGVDFKARQVDRRHAILARQHANDFSLGYEPHLHHGQPKTLPGRLRLLLQRFRQVFLGQQPFTDEEIAKSVGGTWCTGCSGSGH